MAGVGTVDHQWGVRWLQPAGLQEGTCRAVRNTRQPQWLLKCSGRISWIRHELEGEESAHHPAKVKRGGPVPRRRGVSPFTDRPKADGEATAWLGSGTCGASALCCFGGPANTSAASHFTSLRDLGQTSPLPQGIAALVSLLLLTAAAAGVSLCVRAWPGWPHTRDFSRALAGLGASPAHREEQLSLPRAQHSEERKCFQMLFLCPQWDSPFPEGQRGTGMVPGKGPAAGRSRPSPGAVPGCHWQVPDGAVKCHQCPMPCRGPAAGRTGSFSRQPVTGRSWTWDTAGPWWSAWTEACSAQWVCSCHWVQ